jgi:hypothetical protein
MLTLTQPKTTFTATVEVEQSHLGWSVTLNGEFAGAIESCPVWGLNDGYREMKDCGLSDTDDAYIIPSGQAFPNLSAAIATVVANQMVNPRTPTPDYF